MWGAREEVEHEQQKEFSTRFFELFRKILTYLETPYIYTIVYFDKTTFVGGQMGETTILVAGKILLEHIYGVSKWL